MGFIFIPGIKMEPRYWADLDLYLGLVSSGLKKDIFFSFYNSSASWVDEYRTEFTEKINNILSDDDPTKFIEGKLDIGCSPLRTNLEDNVDSLKKFYGETNRLITFCTNNIPDSESSIKLIDCSYGKVRFLRNIVFKGWKEDQKEDLVERLKQSGFYTFDIKLHLLGENLGQVWGKVLKFYKE